MESSIDIQTIDLKLSTYDSQIEIDTTENDQTFSIVKKKKLAVRVLSNILRVSTNISQVRTKAKHHRTANYVNNTV